jgi:hypothetical protein
VNTQRTIIGLGLAAVLALGLAAVLAIGAIPAVAQDETNPEPTPTDLPAFTPSGRPDLYLDMPYVIGGFEPEIVMTRGEEHFANLAQDDPTRLRLEEMLASVDAEPEDMVSGYALVSQEDFFAFVFAVRVDGVEPGTLAPAYLPLLVGNLVDPSASVEQLGGKEVTTVSSVGDGDEYVALYVYDEGDTVWVVQGPHDVAEVTLESLPGPLVAEPTGSGG